MNKKRCISMLLCVAMVLSMAVPAFATDAGHSTQVEYVGKATESYTVTVPSAMQPGETKSVTATGQWQSNHELVVTADESVTLCLFIERYEAETHHL